MMMSIPGKDHGDSTVKIVMPVSFLPCFVHFHASSPSKQASRGDTKTSDKSDETVV
jgi:hypothetical protein